MAKNEPKLNTMNTLPAPSRVEEQLDAICDIAIDAHRDAVSIADEKERLTGYRPHVPDLVDFAPTASLRARLLRRLAERAAEEQLQ